MRAPGESVVHPPISAERVANLKGLIDLAVANWDAVAAFVAHHDQGHNRMLGTLVNAITTLGEEGFTPAALQNISRRVSLDPSDPDALTDEHFRHVEQTRCDVRDVVLLASVKIPQELHFNATGKKPQKHYDAIALRQHRRPQDIATAETVEGARSAVYNVESDARGVAWQLERALQFLQQRLAALLALPAGEGIPSDQRERYAALAAQLHALPRSTALFSEAVRAVLEEARQMRAD